jgi:hypothetical protein
MASDNGREVAEKRRRDRLAASLRENLKRRKTQQRDRAGLIARSPEEDPERSKSSPPLSEN